MKSNMTKKYPMAFKVTFAASAIAQLFSADVWAQGVATDQSLAPITVTGTRSPLDPNLPNTTASVTREELETQNFVNTEDALKYAPNLNIRKRYIGDRNALIGGRSFSNLQTQRGLVYVDGFMISNFLGRFDGPRWNIVAPEEVLRVDTLYGPFSALYPGNSIGTTMAITTRMPEKLEGSIRVLGSSQQFSQYGHKDNYKGDQESAFVGNKLGNLSFAFGLNRLRNESQPMTYQVYPLAIPSAAGSAGTAVTGAVTENDQKGLARVVVGANGGAMETTLQEQAKIKLAYDFSPTLQAGLVYANWQNDIKKRNQTFLRDATGNPVWNGAVNIDGRAYTIANNAFAPQTGEQQHDQLALSAKTRNKTGWNYSVVLSQYVQRTDRLRTANNPDPIAATGGNGTSTFADGTEWRTFETQTSYIPAGKEQHALTFGVHANYYVLENLVVNLSDWRNDATRSGINSYYNGKTRNEALYAQDAWRFLPDWTATFGLRYDRWRGYAGTQFVSGSNGNAPLQYADRQDTGISPKFSVAWAATDDWLLRGSLGKGVRFPTVAELYQGSRSGATIVVNDPNLKPEVSYAKDLTAIRETSAGTFRVSLFEDDIRDTILSQTNIVTNTTNIQNIQRVRTRGIEFAYAASNVFIKGLDIDANLAFNHSKTLDNPSNPTSEGKYWVRVPKSRGNLVATYRADEQWAGMLAARYVGRQYAELDNSDINPDTYGGVSGNYLVFDTKLTFKPTRTSQLALGIDNLTDKRYFVSHPYPGRTIYVEAKLSF